MPKAIDRHTTITLGMFAIILSGVIAAVASFAELKGMVVQIDGRLSRIESYLFDHNVISRAE